MDKLAKGTQNTRERILEAAARIVVDRGIGGLRIRDIAVSVGIREGSLYNNFSGREEIIRALFVDIGKNLAPFGEILDLYTASPVQLEMTRDFIRKEGLAGFFTETGKHLSRFFQENPDSLRLLQAVLSARFHDESARKAYEEIFLGDIFKVIRTVCHFAADDGKLEKSIQAQALAELFAAAFEYAIGQSFASDGLAKLNTTLNNLMLTIGIMVTPKM